MQYQWSYILHTYPSVQVCSENGEVRLGRRGVERLKFDDHLSGFLPSFLPLRRISSSVFVLPAVLRLAHMSSELMESLKLGLYCAIVHFFGWAAGHLDSDSQNLAGIISYSYIWVFVQLIFCPCWIWISWTKIQTLPNLWLPIRSACHSREEERPSRTFTKILPFPNFRLPRGGFAHVQLCSIFGECTRALHQHNSHEHLILQ